MSFQHINSKLAFWSSKLGLLSEGTRAVPWVNFLVCGAQKAGTTALHGYLAQHPDICLGSQKELHFFDDEAQFCNGKPDYSSYHAHFKRPLRFRRVGECTPSYMYLEEALKRIRRYNPAMKLILLLRNPVERAYSHWNMERARGREDLTFRLAIENEAARIADPSSPGRLIYSYVDRGFYLRQLQRVWAYFDREQTLILRYEDLRLRPEFVLEQVARFLGVSPFGRVKDGEMNPFPYLAPMSQSDRMYLMDRFESEIHGLEKILGWDCRQWLESESPGAVRTADWTNSPARQNGIEERGRHSN